MERNGSKYSADKGAGIAVSNIVIKYGEIAVGAKQAFEPSVTEQSDFSKLDQIKQDGLTFGNYGNPIELYSVMLDGSVKALPSDTTDKIIGFWSEQISNADGNFEEPIILTLTASEYFTSNSVSLNFDSYNNIFPTSVNIKWYRDETLLSEKDFQPTTSLYSFQNRVEYYNKVVATFYSMNMPYSRLRINQVKFGSMIEITGKDLKKCSISQKINPISAKLEISTGNIIVENNTNTDYFFQTRQPLSIYANDDLQSTLFIKNTKKQSKNIWNIQSEDYIGIMDGISFYGGVYENKNAVELLTEIFDVAKVPFEIEDIFKNETVTGYIPFTTCRNALMQVLFAIGAVASTANSDIVKIFEIKDEISQTIPFSRIRQGQSIEAIAKVTELVVSYHSYIQTSETVTLYDAQKSGAGENILVSFSDPVWSVNLTGQGSVQEYGANYAIITIGEDGVLTGQKYKHLTATKSKKNPLVLPTDIDNPVKISSATLVSKDNIDKVIEKCYNYYDNISTIKSKIIDGKHITGGDIIRYGQMKYGTFKYRDKTPKVITYDQPIKLGEKIAQQIESFETASGIIESLSFNLVGESIVKDTIMKQ